MEQRNKWLKCRITKNKTIFEWFSNSVCLIFRHCFRFVDPHWYIILCDILVSPQQISLPCGIFCASFRFIKTSLWRECQIRLPTRDTHMKKILITKIMGASVVVFQKIACNCQKENKFIFCSWLIHSGSSKTKVDFSISPWPEEQ